MDLASLLRLTFGIELGSNVIFLQSLALLVNVEIGIKRKNSKNRILKELIDNSCMIQQMRENWFNWFKN